MNTKLTRRLSLILAAVLLLTALAGCTAPAAAQPAASSLPTPSQASPQVTQPEDTSAFPLTVTDHLGREVTLENPPGRLVSGYYITTSLLIALGCADRLVGVEAKAERFPVYALAAPDILSLPNVGSAKEFDLEGCAALNPDLVILPVKLKDAIATLEGLGIAVLGVDPEDSARLMETIAMVGAATGSTERAEKLAAAIDTKYSELAALTGERDRPRVYFAGNSSYLNTAGPAMYQHSLIEAAGAENVAAELEDSYWATVSAEQILTWAPEVIVIAPGASYTVGELMADEAFAGLTAVKEGRVYQMPSSVELWDAPVPSAVLGSLWLASVLHPEAYSEADFAADFSGFYREFYGIEVEANAD